MLARAPAWLTVALLEHALLGETTDVAGDGAKAPDPAQHLFIDISQGDRRNLQWGVYKYKPYCLQD